MTSRVFRLARADSGVIGNVTATRTAAVFRRCQAACFYRCSISAVFMSSQRSLESLLQPHLQVPKACQSSYHIFPPTRTKRAIPRKGIPITVTLRPCQSHSSQYLTLERSAGRLDTSSSGQLSRLETAPGNLGFIHSFRSACATRSGELFSVAISVGGHPRFKRKQYS
jgi:hypothetical protein